MAIDLEELELAVNSVTLPVAQGPNKLEPDTTLKANGWDKGQKPRAEHFNWLFYKLYEAIADLDSRTVVAGQLPPGSIYANRSDARNPSIILGYGSWTPIPGQVLVGVGTHTDTRGEQRTFVSGESGGEYQHSLTESEMPLHGHPYMATNGNENTDEAGGIAVDSNGLIGTVKYTGTPTQNPRRLIGGSGGSQPHNNMQPYTSAYIWERIG